MIPLATLITGSLAFMMMLYFIGYVALQMIARWFPSITSQHKECGYCAQRKATKRCAGCKQVFYCSVKCQVSHWKYGHRKACQKAQGRTKRTRKHNGSTRPKKKREFINMVSALSAFSGAVGNDEDEGAAMGQIDETKWRESYRAMVDAAKLQRKYMTFYAFKVLGYSDDVIPPYEGDKCIGEEKVSLDQMVDSMVMMKRLMIRDPELKHEIDQKVNAYARTRNVK